MKKYNVDFRWGETYDYMQAYVRNSKGKVVRLYAQADSNGYKHNKNWNGYEEYDDLKAIIIKQAKENNINPDCLHFLYD